MSDLAYSWFQFEIDRFFANPILWTLVLLLCLAHIMVAVLTWNEEDDPDTILK